MTTVLIINGPNLGQLGRREPDVYGDRTLDDLATLLHQDAAEGVEIDMRQSDAEGEVLGWLHAARDAGTPVILNAGAWTHYSYAVRDAVAMCTSGGVPVIEVHLSNPQAREEFRSTSVIAPVASGVISGFGFDSYRLALAQLSRTEA